MILILAIGLATGCVYALVAVGYSLEYRTTGVVNFSEGNYVMAGGFSTWWFLNVAGLPYVIAILAASSSRPCAASRFGTRSCCRCGVGAVLPMWWCSAPSCSAPS